ncbi:MAG: lipopolysaccharide transport periplasmic protein LptA [Xanthomonadales bacterium]
MRRPDCARLTALAAFALCLAAGPAAALESDREQPLDVNADRSDGTLGDGIATLRGNIEIRQGTLEIRADIANVQKSEGRVQRIELRGTPVTLQQEIEEQGLVKARARTMEYEVATGIVTLTGTADVEHPQYHISGDELVYDMNLQHFRGSSDDESGRIRIRLDPEVIEKSKQNGAQTPRPDDDPPPDDGGAG